MQGIAELLAGLVVELFRELQQWWLGRSRLRAAVPAGPSQAAPSRGSSCSVIEPLVAEMLGRHASRHVGVAVGVLRAEQTWVMGSGTAGPGGPSPPGAYTIFEIGSVTKVFTATLLAGMVQEGLVGLDDPVQRYLPPGVVLPVRGRAITLGDLAAHTSGLPRLPHGFLLHSLGHRRNPYAWFTIDDLYAGLPASRLRRSPGTRPGYSNFGYGLLGQVLARRADRSYDGLIEDRICRPLGLADSHVSVPVTALDRFAEGHNRRGRPTPHWELSALVGAGGLRSTVADLLAFLRLQLGHGPPALVHAAALTHTPRTRHRGVAIGLGWTQLPLPGTHDFELLFHNGGTGGFRSFVGFVPAAHTGVVVLSNCARSVDALGFRILERITGEHERRATPAARNATSD
jgi:D-alanyl-D-alanine-carboxypeptidase/D-alanyl-D-alanine-endopeptidase